MRLRLGSPTASSWTSRPQTTEMSFSASGRSCSREREEHNSIRYRTRWPRGVFDTTWKFTVAAN